jgi:hypothetical protein
MNHPSSLDLEAFAVGEPLRGDDAGHVEQCATCGAFVEQLRGVVASGPTAKEADQAVARVNAVIAPQTERAARGGTARRVWVITTSVLAPLAAAAAIVLAIQSKPVAEPSPEAPAESTVMNIQMAPLPSHDGTRDTQFKGGMQVAIVLERGKAQTRYSSNVRTVLVRPGDRIRIEVALDHEQAILGAVLADDGSYLELMPEAMRGPGTHFSERSAKIDAAPTRGTILIGTPGAVARARATKQLDGVATLRVESEGP